MTKLLTLKHWQLFGLLMGLPLIFQFVAIGSFMTSVNTTMFFIVFAIMMVFFGGLFFGWFYALGTNLHKKLPVTATMNLTRFKIFLFIPLAYILFLCVFMFGMFLSSDGQPNPAIFAIIVPLHLFSMFCIFYCLYFNAKALKTVEWQKPVTFSDFAGEFFLIWFFPIGIWIIQPRLNKLFDPTLPSDNIQILNDNRQ